MWKKRCFFGPDFLPVCEKTHFVWFPDLYMGWISKRLKNPLFFRGLAPFGAKIPSQNRTKLRLKKGANPLKTVCVFFSRFEIHPMYNSGHQKKCVFSQTGKKSGPKKHLFFWMTKPVRVLVRFRGCAHWGGTLIYIVSYIYIWQNFKNRGG